MSTRRTGKFLSEAQFGCTDAIFAPRQLSETTIEYDEKIAMCFVDQEEAFDRVDRSLQWRVLEQYGVHGQLLDGIRALYRDSACTRDGTMEVFCWNPKTNRCILRRN